MTFQAPCRLSVNISLSGCSRAHLDAQVGTLSASIVLRCNQVLTRWPCRGRYSHIKGTPGRSQQGNFQALPIVDNRGSVKQKDNGSARLKVFSMQAQHLPLANSLRLWPLYAQTRLETGDASLNRRCSTGMRGIGRSLENPQPNNEAEHEEDSNPETQAFACLARLALNLLLLRGDDSPYTCKAILPCRQRFSYRRLTSRNSSHCRGFGTTAIAPTGAPAFCCFTCGNITFKIIHKLLCLLLRKILDACVLSFRG